MYMRTDYIQVTIHKCTDNIKTKYRLDTGTHYT